MMPSRGLLARGNAPQLVRLQHRNLSSTPRIASRIPHRSRTPTSALQSNQWQRVAPLAVPTVASARHLSWWGSSSSSQPQTPSTATSNAIPTPSTAPPVEAATPPPPPPVETTSALTTNSEATFPNLDTITLDSNDIINAAAQAPDTIGYLKSLGLDYGIGVTSLIQSLLEHIHVYSGMPWWGCIAVTAVALRLITLPFYIKASDQNARAAAMLSVTKPINDRMMEAMRSGDQTTALQLQQQSSAIRKRAGLSYWAQFQPMVYQGIIGFCGYRLIRGMVDAPVPGLKDGGFLWLSDLTVSDPYAIMPFIMAASMHIMARMGGESGTMNTATMAPGMKPMLYYGMPGIILLLMGWQPGALCLWFASSGALGMTQGLLLQRPAVRQYLGLAPIYKPAAGEKAANPMDGLLEMLKGRSSTKQDASQGEAPRYTRGEPYMNARYQAPTLNIRPSASSNRIIDVAAVNKNQTTKPDDDMISANRPNSEASGGIFGRAKTAWAKTQENLREQVKREAEKQKIKSQRKAAEEYEKRARGR